MRKNTIYCVLFILLLFGGWYFLQSQHKNDIGKKIVINDDTLSISGYNILGNIYALSNGKTIDADKIIVK